MRRFGLFFTALALVGCVPPASPSQLLADSAFDMNVATRFGRMDVALEYVGTEAREEFTRRHEAWGSDLRVVDVELTSLSMRSSDQADVALNVVWQRSDEAVTRTTRLSQRWQDGRGGWRMLSEQRKGGDTGLFQAKSKVSSDAASGDEKNDDAPRLGGPRDSRASFQTKIIRGAE